MLADEHDFAAMRHYTSFGFDDHTEYLRQMEGMLRDLAARHVHTTVALFDPAEYARFCSDTRLDPDTADSRTRYVARVAAVGATVTYEGQPVADLVAELLDAVEQQLTWESATTLLARAGDCPDCGSEIGRVAFTRASTLIRRLLETAGAGSHHLVCSVPTDGGSLIAALNAEVSETGRPRLIEAEALVFTTVLAAGIATRSPGGLVLRTSVRGMPDTLRGWTFQDGWPQPLTEAEVFAAYCTDVRTGEPIPPEHGVEYRAGFPLPQPEEKR
ncbi:hypothetical protein [Streptomyces sp. XD-27]|uniref:hypothetical protein n=1 Tax=Streptomyces sp. XD-27 TaxID=3062779 RepID=UPI0026F40FFB|nr:hypothetical protein [Streptomyces sp. XD-27]WKX73709.1 hypothetical protein Q3Y56_30955 [Streptomyces sp. XD-27]